MSQTPAPGAAPQPPKFNPAAVHQQRPKLRPVRGFPAKVGEQVVLGLSDARQISDRVVLTSPAAQTILPLMTGERTIEQIVAEVGRGLTAEMLQGLVAQLDDAGLLFGPTFDSLLAKMRAEFDASTVLPPSATAAFADSLVVQAAAAQAASGLAGQEAQQAAAAAAQAVTEQQKSEEGPKRLREAMDAWMKAALEKADNPSLDELPRGIIAPHIDYPRGWVNYASIWGRLRVADRPARVVILGTNHFGHATGVAACDKGYESPLGTCEVDEDLARLMREKLGDQLFEHRYDHEREHSIELQIPWIQHVLGADESGSYPKVFGVLVHDPAVNNGEPYDGNGVGLMPFVEALREAMGQLPGRTLVVSSADLSHVGPAFGDKQPLAGEAPEAEQFRNKVLQHDREMLELVRQRKPDELVASMAWQQNPTRWCSTGNIVAALLVTQPEEVEILNYAAAMDQQGMGMVSSAAVVLR